MKTVHLFFLILLGSALPTEGVVTTGDFYIDKLFFKKTTVGEPQGRTNQALILKWYNYYSDHEKYQKPLREGWKRMNEGDDLKMIYDVCLAYNVPFENTVTLALIESGWMKYAESPVGARGYWQFMPNTARAFGLTVNSRVDERTDKKKSTVAAVKYLRSLKDIVDGWRKEHGFYVSESERWLWALVMYNRGPGKKTKDAFKSARGKFSRYPDVVHESFRETRNYVAKIYGAKKWLKEYVTSTMNVTFKKSFVDYVYERYKKNSAMVPSKLQQRQLEEIKRMYGGEKNMHSKGKLKQVFGEIDRELSSLK